MRYTANRQGIARLLVSGEMHDALRDVGERAADFAASIAPRDSGEYAASFVVGTEVHDERATAILGNTDPGAAAIEWGTSDTTGHHTLSRTIDWIEAL